MIQLSFARVLLTGVRVEHGGPTLPVQAEAQDVPRAALHDREQVAESCREGLHGQGAGGLPRPHHQVRGPDQRGQCLCDCVRVERMQGWLNKLWPSL